MASSQTDTDTAAEEIATSSCEKIDGISSPLLMDNYDTFLLDMWGGESITNSAPVTNF